MKPRTPAHADTRETRRLATLLEMSQALSDTLNFKSSLHRVLEILGKRHGAVRGIVTLLAEEGDLYIEAADGLDEPAQSIRYRVGEGVTRRVVESSKPIVVPRVSREPGFLHPASRRSELSREELSFVCVPILINRKAVGALGVDLRFKAERDFDSSVKFMGVVASMVAQALKVQRAVEDERRRLNAANTHLRQELRERYDFSNIIGTSGPVREMYNRLRRSPRPTPPY
jgi:Nif-specific regulatory protein